MEKIIISNKNKFEEIKKRFIESGLGKIHILADFDGTLTKAFVNGKNIPSVLSVLRDGNYLSDAYAFKAHKLYDKYHLFEVDDKISKKKRKEMMEEWWTKHFKLLIKSGLNKKDIIKVVNSGNIQFRAGFNALADFLKKNNVPLVIMSSSGLGEESVSLKLKKEGKLYDTVYIISNAFKWNKKGNAVSVRKPIIHGANKDETLIRDFSSVFNAIKDRKNVILIGNSLDDVDMIAGFDYENLIKIGFLNSDPDKNLKQYKKIYDVVILGDSSLNFVNYFLNDIGK